jgi:two-component system nitrogen regulation response regulator NtrX
MATAPRILLVDDQAPVREELAYALGYEGFATVQAADGPAALAAIQSDPVLDLVLLDVKMPGMDGLEVLERIRQLRPHLPVLMMSGHGDIDTAVQAVKKGAWDFLQKPFQGDRVVLSIRNALRAMGLQQENADLKRALAVEFQLLGRSRAMEQVRATVARIAPTEAQVLVTGENGTGKELVARQVHLLGARHRGPFVALNCAAVPEELVESELFGHEKGAFTGAAAGRAGLFEQADGGTLFLDEVGDMPLAMQAKLLRALQEQAVQRIGSSTPVRVDVRVVAATNQDLRAMVADKRFREDLYWRLHVVPVHLPPLRERPEDLEDLAPHFLAAACRRNGLPQKRLALGALEWMKQQPWPGNVRQVRNALEGAAVLSEGSEVSVDDVRRVVQPTAAPATQDGGRDWFAYETIDEFHDATEREFLRRKLDENGGNIKRTAERIQLMRSNLYKKLDRHGLR